MRGYGKCVLKEPSHLQLELRCYRRSQEGSWETLISSVVWRKCSKTFLVILGGEMWSGLLAFPMNEAPNAAERCHAHRGSRTADKATVSMLVCGSWWTKLHRWPHLSCGAGLLCRTPNATANMLPTNCWLGFLGGCWVLFAHQLSS